MIEAVRRRQVGVGRSTLGTAVWGTGPPRIVLLHDGLGSIGQWKDLPARLAAVTGMAVLAYDRPGHGHSEPIPHDDWPPDWMHEQAKVLHDLLRGLGVQAPLLVGQSDGASIGLIHAAGHPTSVAGLVTLAPHSYVEDVCVRAIAELREAPEGLINQLRRYHPHAARVFTAWSGGWTNPAFASWDIRAVLSAITAPTIVAQGTADEYATVTMAHETAAAIGPNAEERVLDGVGHMLATEVPDTVIELVVELLARIESGGTIPDGSD